MARRLLAAVDVGSTWTKLVYYDEGLEPVREERVPTPRLGPGRYDAAGILSLARRMMERARGRGASVVGVSVFRASPLAFTPRGEPLTPVYSWLEWGLRREAARRLPLAGRLARRLPVLGRALGDASPLPLIALLARRHPEGLAWTLDAFLLAALRGAYASTASNAALTGLVSPWSLKPMLATRLLAGAGGVRVPEIVPDALGGVPGSLAADQQAAMIGLGVAGPGTVKLSAGTGCFAGSVTGEKPPVTGGVPLVVALLPGGRRLGGVESSVPGLGLVLEWASRLLGGYERLHAEARGCTGWRGGLALRRGPWPGQTVYYSPQEPEGAGGLACAAAVGVGLQCALAAARHEGRVILVGGAAKLPLVHHVAALVLGRPVTYCPGDPAPRGAAYLAALAEGLVGWPPPPMEGCVEEPPPARDPGIARLARRAVAAGDSSVLAELRDALQPALA